MLNLLATETTCLIIDSNSILYCTIWLEENNSCWQTTVILGYFW